jgi:hypothetical protein
MPDCGTISPGLNSCAIVVLRWANLSTISETEFNQAAFRLTASAGGEGHGSPRGRLSAGLGNSMRIATYNVNGINGRLANLLGWLEEAAPDIVCLEELKAPDEKFPAAALRTAGYGAVWHGQKSWNGVAILARAPSRWKPAAACRAIPTTRTAATSKRRSAA